MQQQNPLMKFLSDSFAVWLGHDPVHWAVVVIPIIIGSVILLKVTSQPYKREDWDKIGQGGDYVNYD